MLMNVLRTCLKGHSGTRWTSRASSIKALYSQITEVCKILYGIVKDMSTNPELMSTAQRLFHQIYFQLLCTLSAWSRILSHVAK
jgi:hypothetical protein